MGMRRPSAAVLVTFLLLLAFHGSFAAASTVATASLGLATPAGNSSEISGPGGGAAAATLPPTLFGISGGGAVELGQKITLIVGFSGTGADQTYQWQKGTTNLTGATDATYVINAAVAGDAATYTVTVTNPGGSSVASTAVTVKALAAPVITSSPFSRTVSVGQPTVFNFSATGSFPRTYQWLKSGSAISGATNEDYSIAAAAISDAGTYSVTITNSQGSATSSAASLTINGATPPVLYSFYPNDDNRTQGESVTLSSSITSGSSPYTYQWYKNGTAIAGATSASLTFAVIAVADAGKYKVVVTNIAGSATSREATIAVTPATPVTITQQPQSVNIVQGQSAFFPLAPITALPEPTSGKKAASPSRAPLAVPIRSVPRCWPTLAATPSLSPMWPER